MGGKSNLSKDSIKTKNVKNRCTFENQLNDLITDVLTPDDLPELRRYFEDMKIIDYIEEVMDER